MNQQGQGNSPKTCINEDIDKICDLFNVLPNEFSLLKIEIHPVINLINLGSINRALKSVKNRYSFVKNRYSLLKIDRVLLNIKKTMML
jgi:archaellum component FlaC